MASNDCSPEDPSLDFTSNVYKLVVDHGSDGVLQSIVWKDLKLSSRDGSRLVIRLERRGMIRREKVLEDGRWTYKLTPLRIPVQIKSIEAVPCITCPYEAKCSLSGVVSPLSCPWISEWVTKEYREIMTVAPRVAQPLRQQSSGKRVATATVR
ncbi:MAG: transcriptional regulator [Nitrososphaerales archaeon]